MRVRGLGDPYRGYAPDAGQAATAQSLIDAFQASARAGYPGAAVAWQASNPPATLLGSVPWLPYLAALQFGVSGADSLALRAYVGIRDFPWPNPGPAGFNFGGNATFSAGAAGFAQSPDWRELIARAGGDPDGEYMSAFVQSPMLGAGSQDYARVLYVHQGAWWRPVAAYAAFRTSSWVEFRDFALKPALGFAFAFGLAPWLAAQIGPAIVGPTFAAANPAITSAIGNTVLQTALNGGDIGQALQSVAAGFAGSYAGGQLAQLADSPLLGKVSGAAVSTALRGGDVQGAVVQSLVGSGLSSLGQLIAPDAVTFEETAPEPAPITQGEATMPADYFDPVYTEDATPPVTAADYFDPVYEAPIDVGSGSWSATDWSAPTPTDYSTWTDVAQYGGDLGAGSPSTGVFDPNGASPSTPAPQAGGGGWVADLTNLALAAIKVNAAYQQTKAPPRTVTQSGSVTRTGNANGTITVRNPTTGQQSTAIPEKGVPYVLPDSSVIINNGNGTYSRITAGGQTQTYPYPSAAGASSGMLGALGSISPVWLAVAGMGALLLMQGRSRAR